MTSPVVTEMLDDLFTKDVMGQSGFEYFGQSVKRLDAFIQWLLATIFGSMKSLTDVTAMATLTVCVNNCPVP